MKIKSIALAAALAMTLLCSTACSTSVAQDQQGSNTAANGGESSELVSLHHASASGQRVHFGMAMKLTPPAMPDDFVLPDVNSLQGAYRIYREDETEKLLLALYGVHFENQMPQGAPGSSPIWDTIEGTIMPNWRASYTRKGGSNDWAHKSTVIRTSYNDEGEEVERYDELDKEYITRMEASPWPAGYADAFNFDDAGDERWQMGEDAAARLFEYPAIFGDAGMYDVPGIDSCPSASQASVTVTSSDASGRYITLTLSGSATMTPEEGVEQREGAPESISAELTGTALWDAELSMIREIRYTVTYTWDESSQTLDLTQWYQPVE